MWLAQSKSPLLESVNTLRVIKINLLIISNERVTKTTVQKLFIVTYQRNSTPVLSTCRKMFKY